MGFLSGQGTSAIRPIKLLMISVNPPNGLGQTGIQPESPGELLPMAPTGYVGLTYGLGCPQDGWGDVLGLAFAHGNIMSTIQRPLIYPP